ncbi:MAG: nucleoside phosphorylase [Bacteroidales bacterium]|jgi:uridine phosphorylase|nr:nucleoside phosphorylase [Bacteroidales bacterium]
MNKIEESELIINDDGSVFHLHLLPEQIADDIILVGDPGRVDMFCKHFEKIEHHVQNREFVTKTGFYNGKRLTVLATGIGTDNIDIVINELDALANINLKTRTEKTEKKSLNLLRVGTSGGLQEDLAVGSFLMSEYSIGFDGLLNWYRDSEKFMDLDFENALKKHLSWNPRLTSPYVVKSSETLMNRVGSDFRRGITISSPGFYGPQGRELRLQIQDRNINNKIRAFKYNNKCITNYEMESSALCGLSLMLGHNATTVCVIIANRFAKEFLPNYKDSMEKLVEIVLERLTK